MGPLNRQAVYKGFQIRVYGEDRNYYYVYSGDPKPDGQYLPKDFFVDQWRSEINEIRGKIAKTDKDFSLVEQ
jgi:hypothetical protein